MQNIVKAANLDDSLTARLQEAADGSEVGWQVFMANSLYHLAAHHLRKQAIVSPPCQTRLAPEPSLSGCSAVIGFHAQVCVPQSGRALPTLSKVPRLWPSR